MAIDMALPFKTLGDLERQGLELVVTCQKCRHQSLVPTSSAALRGRRLAGQRFRCSEVLASGLVCRGIGLPAIQKQRTWIRRQAEHARRLANATRRRPNDAGGAP